MIYSKNSNASDAALIGVDWGTSSLRVYLMNGSGDFLDQIHVPEGIMQLPDKNFDAVLSRLIDPWITKNNLPILASGMITSRSGWFETPYLPVPTGAVELADALHRLDTESGLTIHFVTGLMSDSAIAPDVMRGEETQIVGAISSGISDSVYVMPGTHSKWVNVRGGRIENFSTYMTGEIFAALKKHTILGTTMIESDFNQEGFHLGVTTGFEAGSQLLHKLFHARTLSLFGHIEEIQTADYLSGMLIGAEISGANESDYYEGMLVIVGQSELADRYSMALEILGKNSSRSEADIAARGQFVIAKKAGLIA